ncbi:MAG: Purine nucleoside phosphorylase 1 [Verrucomicrobiae bacterium]|nr:Purine nucleoside phosphorylase 1 [Verrucomicrobiae bacterium]
MKELNGFKPEIALIVGSGLGGVAGALTKPITIPYSDIPDFPQPRVAGHAGKLLAGELGGKRLMIFSGRFHHYEGRPVSELVAPVNLADSLGAKLLIVTNAAGGINPTFNPGDLMVIEDHINFMGINPLIGGPTFIDMTTAYTPRLREKLETAAGKADIRLRRGTYLATTGPSYETPAEIKAFGWLGADAVGMSTVPEVIMARAHNMEVAGISCITNLAAGISSQKLAHVEVLEVGKIAQTKLAKLLTEFLTLL